jgi:hypothetical protein
MADELSDLQAETDETPSVEDASPPDFSEAGGDEPRGPSLADMLRQRELDISDDATDDDILSRFEELETAAEERDRLKAENEQYQQWYARQQTQPQQKQEPEPQKAPEAPKAEQPQRPEWNDTWEAYLEPGPNGTVVIAKEHRGAVDPSLPQKYMAYKRWERDRVKQLLDRSDDLFDESRLESKFAEVEERAYKRAVEELRKERQQETIQSFEQKLVQEISPWFKDKSGSITSVGRVFNDSYYANLEKGMSPEEAVEYAKFLTHRQTGQSPWEKPEDEVPEQTPQSKKAVLRKRKNNGTNRLPQAPVKRGRVAEEILHAPSPRELEESWASLMKQEAGIES